jgi:hypothetical protein
MWGPLVNNISYKFPKILKHKILEEKKAVCDASRQRPFIYAAFLTLFFFCSCLETICTPTVSWNPADKLYAHLQWVEILRTNYMGFQLTVGVHIVCPQDFNYCMCAYSLSAGFQLTVGVHIVSRQLQKKNSFKKAALINGRCLLASHTASSSSSSMSKLQGFTMVHVQGHTYMQIARSRV